MCVRLFVGWQGPRTECGVWKQKAMFVWRYSHYMRQRRDIEAKQSKNLNCFDVFPLYAHFKQFHAN